MLHIAPTFDAEDTPEQFRVLSLAYLDASERLAMELDDGTWAPSYHRGQVTLWLALHASELFLKACIRKAAPSEVKNLHSLGELRLAFAAHFPTLEFEPPFGPEPMPADWTTMEMALKSDKTQHEQLRYPVDRANNPWPGSRSFYPAMFVSELRQLRKDIERVSGEVFK